MRSSPRWVGSVRIPSRYLRAEVTPLFVPECEKAGFRVERCEKGEERKRVRVEEGIELIEDRREFSSGDVSANAGSALEERSMALGAS